MKIKFRFIDRSYSNFISNRNLYISDIPGPSPCFPLSRNDTVSLTSANGYWRIAMETSPSCLASH